MGRNITLKISSSERRKKKWQKFKRKIGSSKVLEFGELALQRSKFNNVTDNRK